ncbi:MAG: hypothetical protein NTY19_44340 [Planctomycetota bacterium]|nr:hypothetical protein [Planctomycetota bacterium]
MFAERLPAPWLHVRLLDVGISGQDQPRLRQLSLFPKADPDQQSRLDDVVCQIKKKFGPASLQRALGILHNVKPSSDPPGADEN